MKKLNINNIKKFFKLDKKIIIGVAIIVIGIGIFIYYQFFKAPVVNYEFAIAEKTNLVQEVSVTGKVEPAESVDLAFEKSGKISWINVGVGNQVYVGQTLVQQDNADLVAQLNQAESSVKAQQAKLDELKRGARPEEIKIQEVKIANAKASLNDAKQNLIDKLQDSYTKSDDSIKNKIDQLFNNPRTSSPEINVFVSDSQLRSDINNGRFLSGSILNSWKLSLDVLTVSNDLDSYSNTAKYNLTQIKDLVDDISSVINALAPTSSLLQTTIDNYKSDVSTARTNINTAITNLSTAQEKMKIAESNLSLEENQLTLLLAGTVSEQVLAQEAALESAKANVDNINAQISKTILRSPINGIVAKQEAKQGEIMSANTLVVSVISEAKFEIEVNIPEVDIAKTQLGNLASVTLDAYGEDVVFKAKIVSIEPSETVIEGVPTYKTVLQFIDGDKRVKSGMTANIDISTAYRENVIAIPQRAVIFKNGDRFVKIVVDEEIKEVPVKIGIRSSDGKIEILEGIKESDKVVTFIKE